jgi:hypothetical protein
MKSLGNRTRFRLIASLKRKVGTPKIQARSVSNTTFWPRIVRMVEVMSASVANDFLPISLPFPKTLPQFRPVQSFT